MAKVLKYGKVQPKKVLCPNCEALIEYTDADLDYTALTPTKHEDDRIGLRCPACGKVMLIECYRYGMHCVRQEDGKLHVIDRYETDEF